MFTNLFQTYQTLLFNIYVDYIVNVFPNQLRTNLIWVQQQRFDNYNPFLFPR